MGCDEAISLCVMSILVEWFDPEGKGSRVRVPV